MRHTDWCRIRFSPTSDPGAASALIPLARAQLGQMMQGLALVGQPTGVLRRQLPDGSIVSVSFDGTTPVIDIDVPPAPAASPSAADLFGLWLPRGFLVRPAWSDRPVGVGLPVVANPPDNILDPNNLDPGPSRDRWTAGGPCGQVLLTRDTDAGYPTSTWEMVPLLYTAAGGPNISQRTAEAIEARAWDGDWAAYRIAFASPLPLYTEEDMALSISVREAINATRIAQGVIPAPPVPGAIIALQGASACNLWPKGLYRPAQVAAYLMQANGTTQAVSNAFPRTYRSEADRLTKDGYGQAYAMRYTPPTWQWQRSDIYGAAELRAAGGSADVMVTAWMADSTTHDALLGDYGLVPFLDVGNRGGFVAATLMARDAWLQAGNAVWRCDAGRNLPPLSWRGFASMKLYWETLPITFDGFNFIASVYDATTPQDPALSLRNNGDATMSYLYGGNEAYLALQPVLGKHLYMHGRAIAMAPNGGLVWAAGMLARGATQRLIALVHHNADQPADWKDGLCRYLRVWWVDLPPDGLAAHPEQVVCGTDPDDPLGWKGGELIDMGIVPTPPTPDLATPAGVVNSLKYDSVWRFAPDGSKAACLRDFFSYDQMLASAKTYYQQNTESVVWGGFPIGVELLFSVAGDGGLTTQVAWQPWAASGERDVTEIPGVEPYRGDGSPEQAPAITEAAPTPMAVDYNAQGELVYAFTGAINYLPFGGDVYVALEYAGTGPITTAWTSQMQQLVLLSANNAAIPEMDFEWNGVPQVIDVIDAVFATDGVRPDRCYSASYAGAGTAENPTYLARKQFTNLDVHGVHVTRQGASQALDWYPCPDGVVFQHYYLCDVHLSTYPTLASENVQASYVTYRGDWLLSYQLAPQLYGVPFVLTQVPDHVSSCGGDGQTDLAALQLARGFGTDDYHPRGGRCWASFPLPQAVAGGWMIEATVL